MGLTGFNLRRREEEAARKAEVSEKAKEPTAPVAPTEPEKPTAPVAPTEPEKPTAPTEPTEPVNGETDTVNADQNSTTEPENQK